MDKSFDKYLQRGNEIQGVANEVAGRFSRLVTFQDAITWLSDARALITILEQLADDLTEYKLCQEATLKQEEESRASSTFLKRNFGFREVEKNLKENISNGEGSGKNVERAISEVFILIDQTPTNKAEQKEMVSELRQLKKDLVLEKRTNNDELRQIRTTARQKSAEWTGTGGRGVLGSMARFDRARIRTSKEAALSPHEDSKTRIERQLIETERKINWVSHFIGEEPMTEYQQVVLRCAYCGRRVEPGKVCPGCGSDRTNSSLG